VKAKFWGVRGSIPAPGPETNRYGGNTSCIELRDHAGNLVIIDAGTGIIPLGRELMREEFGKGAGKATVLLSHSHWDHIQGFPFFGPVFVPGNHFTICGGARSPALLEGILEGQMNPNFSPLYTMKNLGADFELKAMTGDGDVTHMGEITVRTQYNPHGHSQALAFRCEETRDGVTRAFVYASDVGYGPDGPTEAVLALYHQADVLVHDCTYSPEDYLLRKDRGFSSIENAVTAAVAARCKRLAMFHYDQDYSDDIVDGLAERTRRLLDERGGKAIELIAAREGLQLEI
jgi:phosphoribosyl 1,2-cyclic phosphodiesterase